MQLVENKRPTSFLIAEISAIRKFTSYFRARWQHCRAILSDAKPACHSPATRRAGRDLALSGIPSFAASAKSGTFQIANRRASQRLENSLTIASSITSKFLIDNFRQDLAFVLANCLIQGPA